MSNKLNTARAPVIEIEGFSFVLMQVLIQLKFSIRATKLSTHESRNVKFHFTFYSSSAVNKKMSLTANLWLNFLNSYRAEHKPALRPNA